MVLSHSNFRAFVVEGCDGGMAMRVGVEVMVMVMVQGAISSRFLSGAWSSRMV